MSFARRLWVTFEPIHALTRLWGDAAADRLIDRVWLSADGTRLSPVGTEGRRRIEDTTDRLAPAPWSALGDAATDRFDTLLRALFEVIFAAGEIRFPNPRGLPLASPA